MEYFPRIHHIAALQQSPRVSVKMSEKPEEFTGWIIFMSMFNDTSCKWCDLLLAVFGKILRKMTFMNSIYFVTD